MAHAAGASEPAKPIHTIILDAGPLIKNVPPVSTLLSQSHALLTTPSIISEIRDPDARTRIQTLYLPFLIQRTPKPESLRFVAEFAKKTGDREVLSKNDLEILALAYEVECERNCGDWRLRREPGQKRLNGKPPAHLASKPQDAETVPANDATKEIEVQDEEIKVDDPVENVSGKLKKVSFVDEAQLAKDDVTTTATTALNEDQNESSTFATETPADLTENTGNDDNAEDSDHNSDLIDESDSDPDGWITPSNMKKRQARDANQPTTSIESKSIQVATITGDFAMQNVLLQMNLNLLSASNMQQIRELKSYILRCHGCFLTTRDMSKQFCPRCGQPTLTRVSCSTSSRGVFKIHLKKNMQWNNRGNVFSVPKPVAGTPHGKWIGQGGGQSGWGNSLILAEDQKEHTRALAEDKRRKKKERDLMDADYLPSILSGERNQRAGGRVKVGAGRTVNSKKR
ncbi:Nin1 binding protein [Myotisia sp. PD_48]|nr:Nin1 binding protein [Myotisia sp. PD_48]